MKLHNFLQQLRLERALTQEDLAKKLGVSRQAVCLWEKGKREIKASTLNKIAEVLGVDMEEVLKSKRPLQFTQRKKGKLNKRQIKTVTFQIYAPLAREVSVTGDFIQWDAHGIPLMKKGKNWWRISIYLKPGRYEYKFIIDGDWCKDPNNPNITPNTSGSYNSVLEVS